MIVGILSILKAGDAYVPLDPSYASGRLRDILVDAAPFVVVADGVGRRVLGESALDSVTVIDPNAIMVDTSER
jgi:non-ribosomal peptide synthetase component F